ncbi:MAG: site-2 protease family protein [Deltaproteobacteria bacterium]|nr:site-2 protease family protein [Deltaproteobacteria bacterium]
MEEYLIVISLLAVPILLAVTVHEVAHGWVADKLGDNTARLAGRLTLNPLKHLDPVGTLVFLVTRMVGWAKPVPVNPYNLRHPRRDMIWVAAAGPAANIILASAFALLYHAFHNWLGLSFNPIATPVAAMAKVGVYINLGLATFNILPIPPLDGSNILMGILPRNLAIQYDRITPYGFIILLALIFTNFVSTVLFPIINGMADLLLKGI